MTNEKVVEHSEGREFELREDVIVVEDDGYCD